MATENEICAKKERELKQARELLQRVVGRGKEHLLAADPSTLGFAERHERNRLLQVIAQREAMAEEARRALPERLQADHVTEVSASIERALGRLRGLVGRLVRVGEREDLAQAVLTLASAIDSVVASADSVDHERAEIEAKAKAAKDEEARREAAEREERVEAARRILEGVSPAELTKLVGAAMNGKPARNGAVK